MSVANKRSFPYTTPHFKIGDVFLVGEDGIGLNRHSLGSIKEIDEDNQVIIEWIIGEGSTHGWEIAEVNERIQTLWQRLPPVLEALYEI